MKKKELPERRWERHDLYGKLPLIRHASVGLDGKVYEWWQYDPAYAPRLPRGAVRGDINKQVFCASCHPPKYFYVDETRRCVQCDQRFIFKATEQEYWYETRQFTFSSVPIRCQQCRRLRRSEHALREQIANARRAVEEAPKDPAGLLALARAIVEYHERTGAGNLEDALAAARRHGVCGLTRQMLNCGRESPMRGVVVRSRLVPACHDSWRAPTVDSLRSNPRRVRTWQNDTD